MPGRAAAARPPTMGFTDPLRGPKRRLRRVGVVGTLGSTMYPTSGEGRGGCSPTSPRPRPGH
jgi:hypothetical protein